jgi:CRP-like cAMP-binding protein
MAATNGFRGYDLFSKLTMDEIRQLDEATSIKDFAEGDSIFEYNQSCSHVFVLMEGTIHLTLPANGPKSNLAVAKIAEKEIFGLSPLMQAPRYTAKAKCITDCRVMAMEADRLIRILERNQMVGMDILNEVAHIYYSRYLDLLRRLQETISQVAAVH